MSSAIGKEFQIVSAKDFQRALQDKNFASKLRDTEDTLGSISMSEAMTKLEVVGDLLRLSFAGSKGFTCSEKVIEILCDYQAFVKDSQTATSRFLSSSFQVINTYGDAIECAQDEEGIETSLELLGDCREVAKKMAKLSEELFTNAHKLHQLSKEALLTAVADGRGVTERQNDLEIEKEKNSTEIAYHQAKIKQLSKEIQKEERTKNEAMARAEKADFLETVVHMGTAGFKIAKAAMAAMDDGGTTGSANQVSIPREESKSEGGSASEDSNMISKAERARDREYAVIRESEKRRSALVREEIESNGKLSKMIEKLKFLKNREDRLERSIVALDITTTTLGKVIGIFADSYGFWKQMEDYYSEYTLPQKKLHFLAKKKKGGFIEGLEKLKWDWIVIAKISYEAFNSISKVNQSVDLIMNHLPNSEECNYIVEKVSCCLIKKISEENAKLEKSVSKKESY